MTLAEIGDAVGVHNYGTVSSAVERVKIRKEDNSDLQRDIDGLMQMIIKSLPQT